MVIIVTGEKGTGKTTFLKKLSEILKRKNETGGILTPAVYSSTGEKTGFDALDVATGQSWPLGRSDRILGGPVFGPFSFSSKGFAAAASSFLKFAEKKSGYIFLDEIGPLETEKKSGFASLLPALPGIAEKMTLITVIRPSLVEKAVNSFLADTDTEVFTVTRENRNSPDLIENIINASENDSRY